MSGVQAAVRSWPGLAGVEKSQGRAEIAHNTDSCAPWRGKGWFLREEGKRMLCRLPFSMYSNTTHLCSLHASITVSMLGWLTLRSNSTWTERRRSWKMLGYEQKLKSRSQNNNNRKHTDMRLGASPTSSDSSKQ